MKLTFVSNALTPHQIPFCEACINILGDGFSFVSVAEVTDERKTIGWGAEAKDYEIRSYESSEAREKAITSINEADVLILGSASEDIIKSRLKAKKLTFKYSERQYKKPLNIKTYPHALAGAWLHFGRYQSAPFYLLCASAYASADFMKFGNFKNRAFKWGYFPATYEYDIDVLMAKKESRTITWAARMIDWKHPELAVEMARRLKADGIDFTLNVIGFGVMENEIRESVARLGLADCVKLLGSMKPEEVREYMEKSAVFLMTSDRQEGWGAVLNEAQNSACAVLANSAAGSAPYLIKNGENGFIYNEKDIDDMYAKLKLLLLDTEKREAMGRAAYQNIHGHWNAENAAKRFVTLAEHLLSGGDGLSLFDDGICSPAEHYRDGWYSPKGDA